MFDCKQSNIASGATPIGNAGRVPDDHLPKLQDQRLLQDTRHATWKSLPEVFDSTRHLGAIVVGMTLRVPNIGTPGSAQLEAHSKTYHMAFGKQLEDQFLVDSTMKELD